VSEFTITKSIIHQCYAIKVPQSFGEKLAGVSQILPCYGMSFEECEELASYMSAGHSSTDYWIDRLVNYRDKFIPQLKRDLASIRESKGVNHE